MRNELSNSGGQVVKSFVPLHDATMRNHQGLFALLERYLDALDLERVARIVFCGDGAPWIWSGVEALCQRRGLDQERVDQVIDYTHAKQNLQELIDLLPARLQREGRLARQWRDWLWQGHLEALYQSLCETFRGKKKAQALNKWDNYFARNHKRLQYARFRELAVPCGSGCVESAIRRVINLRLKAPGTFWTHEMAECFLYLRSQLLSGRWDTFIQNVARLKTRLLDPLQHAAPIAESQADEYLQAA